VPWPGSGERCTSRALACGTAAAARRPLGPPDAARPSRGGEPMARAIWTGSINFGLVTIPVKLYPAVREHSLHFNYLHREAEGPIRYERVCSVCGKKVDWQDIVRGFDVGDGRHVVVSDEDFDEASPEATHAVDIVEFVDIDQIDPILFDTPYYLEPERR